LLSSGRRTKQTFAVRATSVAAADKVEQTTFATPEEVGHALQSAARTNDESALNQILGSEAKAILSSGDPEEDKAALVSFVTKYDRMNRREYVLCQAKDIESPTRTYVWNHIVDV
jgi:hypothetical protein